MCRPRPKPKSSARGLDILAKLSREDNSDILGSYTGTPADPEDPVPVQDADDL